MDQDSLAGESQNQPDSFEAWLLERHAWLHTAAARLINKRRLPNKEELGELVRLCVNEASGSGALDTTPLVPGALALAAQRPEIRLQRVFDVQAVNALKNGAAINFGSANLFVVYGLNGSGKTGFSRILKHAAGARAKGDLHPNVFDTSDKKTQAKFALCIDGAEQPPVDWSLEAGPLKGLRDVHIFDADCAAMYVSSENEATYEPSRMRFVSSLIKICDQVAEVIREVKQNDVSKLPSMPVELNGTSAGKWLRAIDSEIDKESIEAACAYPKELDQERIAAEGVIAQKDVSGRLLEISKDLSAITRTESRILSIKNGLDDEVLQKVVAARSAARTKRVAANDAAKIVFGNAPIHGVGEESWLELWSQARAFSEAHAYPDIAFPNVAEDARCVLCQQELRDPEVRPRLLQFEEYVTKGLESEAKKAEEALAVLAGQLPICPDESDWLLLTGSLKLDEASAQPMLGALGSRIDSANTAIDLSELFGFDWSAIDSAAASRVSALKAEEKLLKDSQTEEKRRELEARISELKALQWLSQNKVAIEEECTRLKRHAVLDASVRLANTSALTKKNNQLASDEVAAGYQARFAAELEKIGGRLLPVKPVSKVQGKGRVTFGIELINAKRNVPPEKVLSEGEIRIVALAAFLADITAAGYRSTFIFDDPISSLDQDYEERVVDRLIELSRDRQVIVFTHRLSLLCLLEAAAKKLSDQAKLEKVEPPVRLGVETLRRLGPHVGLTAHVSLRDSNPKSAVNRLRDEGIPKLRKLQDGGQVDEYQRLAESFCSDFRIILERCVESVLLNDVVVRFRRSLQTQGRISSLAKISSADCALFDGLMTRYSVFEHSQARELPAPCPALADLESDIAALATWIDEYGKRAVA